ncbi:hypothetical protein [Allofournierella massiliensis]|uniref:hypothetical protein n=1 Tax=Allofournierella massiliensis TaxID=1650663 RepID=UPI003561E851
MENFSRKENKFFTILQESLSFFGLKCYNAFKTPAARRVFYEQTNSGAGVCIWNLQTRKTACVFAGSASSGVESAQRNFAYL